MKKFLEDLKWRGLLNNITNEEKLSEIKKQGFCAYIGFDPSAKSLHLGNYVMIMMLKRLSNAGIKTYALVGGATGMIGDPSGKQSERKLLDLEQINFNKQCIIDQLKKYANVDVLDNYTWYQDLSFLDFLRIVGKKFNINYMLDKETVANRLETGISFTEFSYTLMQAYDFATLYENNKIGLQVGGSDQWGNITSGIDLIRKNTNDDNCACGLTINLLTKSDGTKFGKSEKGAIYLDPSLSSSYAMYQFLINQEDSLVIKLIKFLTFLTKDEIDELEESLKNEPFKRMAQKKLAELVVTDIHGKESYEQALKISQALFTDQYNLLTENELAIGLNELDSYIANDNEINLIQALVNSGACESNNQARTLINSNSISINNVKISDINYIITKQDALFNKYTIIKKGKRNYYIIKWE